MVDVKTALLLVFSEYTWVSELNAMYSVVLRDQDKHLSCDNILY